MSTVLTGCYKNKKSYFSRFRLLLVVALCGLVAASVAHAGWLSGLSKLSKASKAPDADVSLLSKEPLLHALELKGIDADKLAEARPNLDGSWKFRQPDGSFTEQLHQSPEAVVLDAFFIPSDMARFAQLPTHSRIVIRGKEGQLFELARSGTFDHAAAGWVLHYQNLQARVNDATSLKQLIWQLQRPMPDGHHLVKLGGHNPHTGDPNTLFDMSSVTEVFDQHPRSTVMLAIDAMSPSNQIADLERVSKLAADRDITLILTNDSHPINSLKHRPSTQTQGDWLAFNQQTFNKQAPNERVSNERVSKKLMFAAVDGTPQNILALSRVPDTLDHSVIHDSAHMVIAAGLHSSKLAEVLAQSDAVIVHPDQARSEELDQRIIPWLPSSVQFYLLISFFLGVLAPMTCWRLWHRVWPVTRPTFRWPSVLLKWPVYVLYWCIHKCLFLMFALPLFGAPCFTYVVIRAPFLMIRWLLRKMGLLRAA